jgi:hypothetical protein
LPTARETIEDVRGRVGALKEREGVGYKALGEMLGLSGTLVWRFHHRRRSVLTSHLLRLDEALTSVGIPPSDRAGAPRCGPPRSRAARAARG